MTGGGASGRRRAADDGDAAGTAAVAPGDAPAADEETAETPQMLDESRLVKLLARIGSSHDGEVLNAARLADRLVRRAGLTWDDILAGPRRRLWKQLRRNRALRRHSREASTPGPASGPKADGGDGGALPRVEALTDRQILEILTSSPLVPARMRHELRPLVPRLTGNTLPIDDRAYVRALYSHAIFYGRAI